MGSYYRVVPVRGLALGSPAVIEGSPPMGAPALRCRFGRLRTFCRMGRCCLQAARPCALYGKQLKRTATFVRVLALEMRRDGMPASICPLDFDFHPMDRPIHPMDFAFHGHFGWKNGVDLRHIVAKIAFLGVLLAWFRGDVAERQVVLIFAYLRASEQSCENNRFSVLKKRGWRRFAAAPGPGVEAGGAAVGADEGPCRPRRWGDKKKRPRRGRSRCEGCGLWGQRTMTLRPSRM